MQTALFETPTQIIRLRLLDRLGSDSEVPWRSSKRNIYSRSPVEYWRQIHFEDSTSGVSDSQTRGPQSTFGLQEGPIWAANVRINEDFLNVCLLLYVVYNN